MNTMKRNAAKMRRCRFVNTIETKSAKNAEVVRFVNTIDNEANAKNAEVFYL